MKKWMAIVLAVAVVPVLAGAAGAQMGWGPGYGMHWGGPGWMAWGPGGGPGAGGPGAGGPCPGAATAGDTTTAVTEEKAKEIAEQYVAKYLKGYKVEKVLPFTGMRGWTAYSVELKGPNDEVRTLHVNPWGGVMPFGGPGRRTG
jgi:hypothetical protein